MWAEEVAIRCAKPSQTKVGGAALKIDFVDGCTEAVGDQEAATWKASQMAAFGNDNTTVERRSEPLKECAIGCVFEDQITRPRCDRNGPILRGDNGIGFNGVTMHWVCARNDIKRLELCREHQDSVILRVRDDEISRLAGCNIPGTK